MLLLSFQYHLVFMDLMNLYNLRPLKGISSLCCVNQVEFHPKSYLEEERSVCIAKSLNDREMIDDRKIDR